MTIPNVRLTRLEGVNRILRKALGASPVNTLDPPLPPEAVAATDKLDDVQRDLMSEGWDMNTDYEIELEPDVDGLIYVPQNAIRVTFEDAARATQNVVVRDGKLYDETDQTDVFTDGLEVTITRLLDFSELEYWLQRYIVARGARELSSEMLNDLDRVRTLSADERMALAAARRADNDSARYNILAAPTPLGIIARHRPRLF